MNWILRSSALSVAGLVATGGIVAGPTTPAHAATANQQAAAADDKAADRADDDRAAERGDRPDARERGGARERTVAVDYEAQPNFYYCGPAAARIALSAKGAAPSQDELAEKLGTTVAGTNSAEDVTRVLNELRGAYRTVEIRESAAKPEQVDRLRADVVAALDADRPVVANIKGSALDTDGRQHSFPGGHYLTVVAYRDGGDTVKIADPADPIGEYWMTTERLAHWIAERGYSA